MPVPGLNLALEAASPAVLALWERYVGTAGPMSPERFFEVFHFDDNQPSADELADLVVSGRKRATAALLWSYESENKPLPVPSNLSVVTRWSGEPVCIIETTSVQVVAFDQVTEEFAAIEGEGDGTLAYWRRVHTTFFARECARLGRELTRSAPIVCEKFEVVFPPPAAVVPTPDAAASFLETRHAEADRESR